MLAFFLDPRIVYDLVPHTQGLCKSLIAPKPYQNGLRKRGYVTLRDKLSNCYRHLMVVSIVMFHSLEIKCVDCTSSAWIEQRKAKLLTRAAFRATAIFLFRKIEPVQLMAFSRRTSASNNARRVLK